jgi:hypothetical protein
MRTFNTAPCKCALRKVRSDLRIDRLRLRSSDVVAWFGRPGIRFGRSIRSPQKTNAALQGQCGHEEKDSDFTDPKLARADTVASLEGRTELKEVAVVVVDRNIPHAVERSLPSV